MTDKIVKLMAALKDAKDKSKLHLTKRKLATGKWYYIKDSSQTPHKWFAIGTQDEQIARRVHTELTSSVAYGQSEVGAIIQLNLGKLDRDMRDRTWGDVHNHYVNREGLASKTTNGYRSCWKVAVSVLRDVKVVETTRSQLTNLYKESKGGNQKYLKNLYNHAKGEGWLINQNLITPNEWVKWKKTTGGTTASITDEQHFAIIAAMEKDLANWDATKYRMRRRDKQTTAEIKSVFEVLWEIGGSNADCRELTTDNINWESGHIIFKRKKWKAMGKGNKRTRQAIHFPMSQKLKDIILPYYNTANKDGGGYLFPITALWRSDDLTRVLYAYMGVAGIPRTVKGEDGQELRIIIHSYRYRMAEHLFEIGATEKEAKALMGWRSHWVMQAYSKGANMNIPALDVMAEERGRNRVINIAKVA